MSAVAFMVLVIAWSIRFANPGGILLAAAYGVLGLVLVLRRPGQPLAWLLLLIALGIALGTTVPTASPEALLAGAADALGQLTGWAAATGWVFVFIGFLGIVLLFPAGRFAGGRWRAVSFATIAACGLIAGLLLFGPTIEFTPEQSASIYVPNPFALPFLAEAQGAIPSPGTLYPLLLPGLFVALLLMLARLRHATGLERLQYRWLWWAVVVVVLGTVAWAVVTFVLAVEFVLLSGIIIGLTYPAIPIAVVVAVLRYRLYEIDRLVSRTVGWALATAAVLGVFGAGVLAFGGLLSGLGQGQAVATAGATLLAFALFQPLRSRLQRIVDRRFDRPRIEAERTLERHGEQLAHEVELDVIERRVIETVAATVRPVSTGLWTRSTRRGAGAGPTHEVTP